MTKTQQNEKRKTKRQWIRLHRSDRGESHAQDVRPQTSHVRTRRRARAGGQGEQLLQAARRSFEHRYINEMQLNQNKTKQKTKTKIKF